MNLGARLAVMQVVGGILLALVYVLPVEEAWAPIQSIDGYGMMGGVHQGWDLWVVHGAPHLFGLLAAVLVFLRRWPRLQVALLSGMAALWVTGGAAYAYRLW